MEKSMQKRWWLTLWNLVAAVAADDDDCYNVIRKPGVWMLCKKRSRVLTLLWLIYIHIYKKAYNTLEASLSLPLCWWGSNEIPFLSSLSGMYTFTQRSPYVIACIKQPLTALLQCIQKLFLYVYTAFVPFGHAYFFLRFCSIYIRQLVHKNVSFSFSW